MRWNSPYQSYGPLYMQISKRDKSKKTVCKFVISADGHYCEEWFDGEWVPTGSSGKMKWTDSKKQSLSCVLGKFEGPTTCGTGSQMHRNIATRLVLQAPGNHQCTAWYTNMVAITQAYLGMMFTVNTVNRMENCYGDLGPRKAGPIAPGARRANCPA